MRRRTFLRLITGTALATATGATVGACSTELPAAALAPWRDLGAGTDVRLWALGHAILAPSPHNLQSWLVDLRERDALTLWVDPARVLPDTDPLGRQVIIGQGTFLEILRLALGARGLHADVQAFPAGPPGPSVDELGARPVARVTWRAGGSADPLFAEVLRRRTPKGPFDSSRPVSPETLTALATTAEADVLIGSIARPREVAALRDVCRRAARIEMDTPRTAYESLRLTRIGPAEIAFHRDGISINERMPRLAAALGLLDRTAPPAAGSFAYEQMQAHYARQLDTAAAFIWMATPNNSREQQLAAGRVYMRLQLHATALGIGIHPLSQALQEYAEMSAPFQDVHRVTLRRSAPRASAEPTLQMLCRVGYPQMAVAPAPRRSVSAIVRE